MSLALMIRKDGIVDPFGLNWLRTSRFPLIAGTRDGLDDVGGMDGAVDFGSMLGTDDIVLELVSEDGLSPVEIVGLRNTVVGYLNQLRDYGTLSWEADPDKVLLIRLNGKPSRDVTILRAFQIGIPLLCQPLWYGDAERILTTSGTAINAGTFETPMTVEIRGPCTNPTVTVNGKIMAYAGTLTASDILIIDTGALTCTFNEINAFAFNGVFPTLLPGENIVNMGQVNTTVKWRDCWL